MNSVNLIGRLAKDPELRETKNGKSVCSFPLAVDNPYSEGADFFDVTAWGKTAENTAKYMVKGSQVGVNGRLEQQKWEQDGQKRSKVAVIAERVTFLQKANGNKDDFEDDPF